MAALRGTQMEGRLLVSGAVFVSEGCQDSKCNCKVSRESVLGAVKRAVIFSVISARNELR